MFRAALITWLYNTVIYQLSSIIIFYIILVPTMQTWISAGGHSSLYTEKLGSFNI